MIWIDLSLLYYSSSPCDGTKRVVWSLAESLKDESCVRFCIYLNKSIGFVDISAEEVLRKYDAALIVSRYGIIQGFVRKILTKVQNLYGYIFIIKRSRKKKVIFCQKDAFLSLHSFFMFDKQSSYFDHLTKNQKPGYFYVFVHDLMPVMFPQYFYSSSSEKFGKWLNWAFRNKCLFIVNSECAKNDLKKYSEGVGAILDKISVIRLSDEIKVEEEPVENSKLQRRMRKYINEEFVLYVSTIEKRKNHKLLYNLWKMLLQSDVNYKIPHLIFVGKEGWLVEDMINSIKIDPIVKGKLHLMGNVNDQELIWLYKHCLFTAYPSLYEGWGLPVAESLRYGKYCIASKLPSLYEVGGNLIDYHEPNDLAGCKDLVVRCLKYREYLKEKERNIKKYYKSIRLEEFSKNILGIINSKCVS